LKNSYSSTKKPSILKMGEIMSLETARFHNPIVESINGYYIQVQSASRRDNLSQQRPTLAQQNSVDEAITEIVKLSKQYWDNTTLNTERDPSKLKTIREEVNLIGYAVHLIKSLNYHYYDIGPLTRTPRLEENLYLAKEKLCLIEADQIRKKAGVTDKELEWAVQILKVYQGESDLSESDEDSINL
jgi:hypothetical protein